MKGIWRIYRNLVVTDLKIRYGGSLAAKFWVLFQPMFYLLFMTVVFFGVLDVRFGGGGLTGYVTALFLGLLPFLALQESLVRASVSMFERAQLIRCYPVNKYLVPLVPCGPALITQGIATAAGILILTAVGRGHPTMLLVPVVIGIQIAGLTGLSLLAASFFIERRELQPLLHWALQGWLFLSPVFYPQEKLPGFLGTASLGFNPLAQWAVLGRLVVIEGRMGPPEVWGVALLLNIALLAAGVFWYSRRYPVLVDRV